jgi:hypothetical protein
MAQPNYLAILLALATTMAAWYALRHVVGAVVGVAVGILVLSYLSDPSQPLALALQTWALVREPLFRIAAVLWALAQRALAGLSSQL